MEASPENEASSASQVFLTWVDLTVKIQGAQGQPRYLLKNVDGYAKPGNLDCIMGPSGSGKTTLLNALAGRLCSATTRSGQILANGRRQELAYGNSAYVTQDDSLIATLTIYETILYSAHLQLPDKLTTHEKHCRVQRVIKEMGLQDSVNTRIGGWHVRGLSGGEKRRVSIAIEILKHPQLLFLDEPTSGLDSAAAYHVVKRLRAVASVGTTVLVSIHQPSSEVFGLFDRLTLLSAGQTVYFGEADKVQQFFDDCGFPCPGFRNPSDHCLWVINSGFEEHDDTDIEDGTKMTTSEKVQLLVSAYHESEIRKESSVQILEISCKEGDELKGSERATFFKQAFYLTSRSFTNMRRDGTYYWFRLFVYMILSTCTATIFYNVGLSYHSIQARAGLLMFIATFMTFMGVVSFPAIMEDMKIFSRERLNGHYGVAPFVISNSLSSFPFIVLLSLFPGIILYFIGGLHPGFVHFLFFFLTLLACLSIVESLLMAVATVAPDYLTGMIAGCGIMGMYVMTGGFFRLLNDLPKPVWRYPLSYISFHTWANRAFYNNDFQGLLFENIIKGEDVLRDRYQMDIPYSKWWTLVVLVSMTIAYRIIFVISLKLKEKLPDIIRRVHTNKQVINIVERSNSDRYAVLKKEAADIRFSPQAGV